MISIESNLYNGLLLLTQLIVLNFLFYIASIPFLSIPIAILYLCHCIINIMDGKKMFAEMKLTKRVWKQFLFAALISCFSAFTIYSLIIEHVSFVKLLVISFIISFNLITYILILSYETKMINLLRASFFYTIVYFYKTVLVIFAFLLISMKLWEYSPVVFIVGTVALYFYVFIKLNYKTLLTLGENLER